jgi:hypothetical protein
VFIVLKWPGAVRGAIVGAAASLGRPTVAVGRMRFAPFIAIFPVALRPISVGILDTGRLVDLEGKVALRQPIVVPTRRTTIIRRWRR